MNATQLFSRRHALRLALGVGLATVPAFRSTGDAAAGRTWCRYDPVMRIDGQIVDVWLAGDADLDDTVIGPTRLVVEIPAGAATEVLASDLGFGKLGYDISFAETSDLGRTAAGPDLRVSAYVPATADLPVAVTLAPRSANGRAGKYAGTTASGTANAWIAVATKQGA